MVTVQDGCAQFRFYRPQARNVYLVGDFNGWQTTQLRMVPTGDGHWVAAMRLPKGFYKFRYLADGQWFVDYAAFGIEYGPFGADSVVRIAPHERPGHFQESQDWRREYQPA